MLGVLLTACSKGPQADLPSIGEARSLGAEWALVNEQLARGRVTVVYADTMRGRLREQLDTNLTSLTQQHSEYAGQMRALLALPDDVSPAVLRAHAKALKRIEDKLESA